MVCEMESVVARCTHVLDGTDNYDVRLSYEYEITHELMVFNPASRVETSCQTIIL